jgi:hypothetical protein
MKYIILLSLLLTACDRPFFHSWYSDENSIELCQHFCNIEKSRVKQSSSGLCACNSEQGLLAVEAYHAALAKLEKRIKPRKGPQRRKRL